MTPEKRRRMLDDIAAAQEAVEQGVVMSKVVIEI